MQYKTSKILAIIIFICIVISPQLFAIDLSTQDGLILSLDNTSGQITRLSVNSQDIALFPGIYGGLQFYEPIPITSQQTIFYKDFNTSEVTWNSAIMDNWEASTIYYNWGSSGGVSDSGHLTLGNGIHTGCGIAFPQKITISHGSVLKISWFGKSANIESKYIFCIRLFNENNEDITQQSNEVNGQELISNLPISINVNEPSKQLSFTINISSNDVKVISLYASSSEVPFNFWGLF